MQICLIDVDGHNGFPNLPLMKISSYYKTKSDNVEWHIPVFCKHYDVAYLSKVFTFSEDYLFPIDATEIVKGGTGYDITSKLPIDIEKVRKLDYSIYPNIDYSIQFYSRGCIRHCPFCCVHDKEGYIRPQEPMDLNPKGNWIQVLDNNFFANPEWRSAVEHLKKCNQPIKFHGIDVRILTEEMVYSLKQLKMRDRIHIAWDLPQIDLRPQLKELTEYINPNDIVCYVLVGFNSTKEQDMFRLQTLKDFRIAPFVQPYRDFKNKRIPSMYEKDIAKWANQRKLFFLIDFKDYSPRKGFTCKEYFK